MAVKCWKDLMEEHYPKCAWLYLRRDVFESLYAYRRRNGIATWEQTVEALLNESQKIERESSSSHQREREEVPA
jgi:hypothetical protein